MRAARQSCLGSNLGQDSRLPLRRAAPTIPAPRAQPPRLLPPTRPRGAYQTWSHACAGRQQGTAPRIWQPALPRHRTLARPCCRRSAAWPSRRLTCRCDRRPRPPATARKMGDAASRCMVRRVSTCGRRRHGGLPPRGCKQSADSGVLAQSHHGRHRATTPQHRADELALLEGSAHTPLVERTRAGCRALCCAARPPAPFALW
jgi:hypothetical protein